VEGDAGLRGDLPDHDHVVDRAAGVERVHRRAADPAGRIRGEQAVGVVLGAAYMLYLYQRTMFGKIENPKNERLIDLNNREFATFAPLLILAFWMGLYPSPFLVRLEPSVQHVIARVSPQYAQKNAADCTTSP